MEVKLLSYTGEELYKSKVGSRWKFMSFLDEASKAGVDWVNDADILSTIELINKEYSIEIKSYLLVDDNEPLLKANAKLISKRGHFVKTFTDPEDAKDYFSEDPDFFDIIILDNHMPGILGNDLAKDFCDQTTKSSVYMLTGYGNEVDVHHEHRVFIMHKGKENLTKIVPSVRLTGIDQEDQAKAA